MGRCVLKFLIGNEMTRVLVIGKSGSSVASLLWFVTCWRRQNE